MVFIWLLFLVGFFENYDVVLCIECEICWKKDEIWKGIILRRR